MSKPFKGGAYAYQRFNFVRKGQAHERNAEASNRTCYVVFSFMWPRAGKALKGL